MRAAAARAASADARTRNRFPIGPAARWRVRLTEIVDQAFSKFNVTNAAIVAYAIRAYGSAYHALSRRRQILLFGRVKAPRLAL